MHRITVISKHGCHLCENAIRVLESLNQNSIFALDILYIEDDRSLHEKYWLEIPVVRLDGKDVFQVEEIALESDCKEKLGNLVHGLGQD
jgi:glutaredoxin